VLLAETLDKEKPLDEIVLPANSYVCGDCNFVIEKASLKSQTYFALSVALLSKKLNNT